MTRFSILALAAVTVALLAVGPAAAQAPDWSLRPDDRRFDADAVAAAVTGRVLTFHDGGESNFPAGGAYSYTYAPDNGGGTQFGTWAARRDGRICIAYRNGRARCDLYVFADGRIVVLTEAGGRFPVRAME